MSDPDSAGNAIEQHRPIGYAETEFQTQKDFAVSAAADGRGVDVSGLCPACGGRTTMTFERGSPNGSKGLFGRRSDPPSPTAPAREVTVYCECGHLHADRPAEATDHGCGAFWSVELR